MRILHVLHSPGYGGAENHALVLMRAQQAAGHEVMFAGLPDCWLARQCTQHGIPTHGLRMAGLFDLVSHVRLRRLVRQWVPDIVHGHLVRGSYYAGWAAQARAGTTAISTAHATTAHKHMGRCRHIIAVSGAVQASLLAHGHPASQVSVVYNGMPDAPPADRQAIRQQLGIADDVFAVVNVGRFVRDKGQDLAVQALQSLPERAHLYLIGDPDTAFGREVRQLAGHSPRVHFLGYRADVPELLAGFDCYASTSRREALGLSLVEGAAAALPTVATAVGGVPEVVLDGHTGWLVPSEDTQALAQALQLVMDHPEQAHAMGQAARQHYLNTFTVDGMLARTLRVYEQARQRILIIRLSALGDVVMASGLIPAIRSQYPHAHLAWLTEAPAAPLLKHNPRLDEVIIWPKEPWKKLFKQKQWSALWQQIRQFKQDLQDRRFDLVLDAQGLLKSGVCAWMTDAPQRIGLQSREGSQWLVTQRIAPTPGQDVRMGSEYRFLARHLGAPDAQFVPDLAIGQQAQQRAQQALQDAGLKPGTAYAALAPFTTRPQKHWVEGHWIQLARALMAQGLTPVYLGGPADAEAAQRMAAQTPGALAMAGPLKLDESAAVVAQCRILIGVDTGLTHMGSALRRPTIALFGSTCPYTDSGSPDTRILYDALPCAPCRRRPTCGGRFDCMSGLTVDRVRQQIHALIGTPSA